MKFPVLWSRLCCCTVKCSEILAHIKLLYNPRVNKVFTFTFRFTFTHSLNLKTKYAKALAREEAYAEAEVGNFVPNKVPASYTRVDVPDVSANAKVKWTDGVKSSQFASSGEKKKGTVKAKVNLAAIDQSGVASGSSSGSEKSGLSDMAYEILAQQNRVMKVCVRQQQRNSLPRRRVPVFSGNPLDYYTFIRALRL